MCLTAYVRMHVSWLVYVQRCVIQNEPRCREAMQREEGEKARRRCWFTKWPQHPEGKERPKTEADQTTPDGWAAVSTSRKKNLPGFSWGCYKTSRSPPLPFRILKVYRETLVGSVIYSVQMASTTHCSLKAVSSNMVPSMGTVGGTYIPRTGE